VQVDGDGIQAWVGITDGDWYRFLAGRPDLDEVNFWQPGGSREFRRLGVGQPLLFTLHAPDNFIVGAGFFRYSTLLPATAAWEAFGDENGATEELIELANPPMFREGAGRRERLGQTQMCGWPPDPADRPSRQFLEWHADTVFKR
jgi:hypothetical protein